MKCLRRRKFTIMLNGTFSDKFPKGTSQSVIEKFIGSTEAVIDG